MQLSIPVSGLLILALLFLCIGLDPKSKYGFGGVFFLVVAVALHFARVDAGDMAAWLSHR